MPSVITAPAQISGSPAVYTPFTGAKQARKAPTAIAQTSGFFNPSPVASALAGGTIGTGYSETITGTGGTSPYTFSVTGSLPGGLSLNSTAGVISGTPTTAGTFAFTIQVTDANGYAGSQSFSIAIATATASGGGNYGFVA